MRDSVPRARAFLLPTWPIGAVGRRCALQQPRVSRGINNEHCAPSLRHSPALGCCFFRRDCFSEFARPARWTICLRTRAMGNIVWASLTYFSVILTLIYYEIVKGIIVSLYSDHRVFFNTNTAVGSWVKIFSVLEIFCFCLVAFCE